MAPRSPRHGTGGAGRRGVGAGRQGRRRGAGRRPCPGPRPEGAPEPEERDERTVTQWRERCLRSIEHDPGGCWVAEDDDALLGVAISAKRELMWVLSGFAVAPNAQGSGLGTRLL